MAALVLAGGGRQAVPAARGRRDRLSVLGPRERLRVREAFARELPIDQPVESHLRAVVADTLGNPGSLARAQLAYGVGTRLGLPVERALQLAVAVEYFHSASLIFDDMPAMDDAAVRRGRPCPHLVHGEGAAILGALALITRAYALVWAAVGDLPRARRSRATDLVAECLGLSGILDGQARDLHFSRGAAQLTDIEQVAAAKTVPLLRLAIVLPAVAAGTPAAARHRLERLAAAWGLGYQILDDFKDCLLSDDEAGKTTDRDESLGRPNLPEAAGTRHALVRLDAQLDAARRALDALPQPSSPRWFPLRRLQAALDEARGDLSARLQRAGRAS